MSPLGRPELHQDASPQAAKQAVQAEIERVKEQDDKQSLLRLVVDALSEPYHHRSRAVKDLQQVSRDLNGTALSANSLKVGSDEARAVVEKAVVAIAGSRRAQQDETDAYKIGSGAVKTLGSFAAGKFGMAVAGLTYCLDDLRANDLRFADGVGGAGKGLVMTAMVQNLIKGSPGPAAMILEMGVGSRAVEAALTNRNYLDKDNNYTVGALGDNLVNITTSALNPIALASDLATAGLTHGLIKVAPAALSANRFRSLTTTSFARGMATGLSDEGSSQYQQGELSLPRLVAYPLANGLTTALAAAPGNQSHYARGWALENGKSIRELDYRLVAIADADVAQIAAKSGRPVQTTVRPVGDELKQGAPETLSISKARVPVDWLAQAGNWLARASLPGDKKVPGNEGGLRLISRPRSDDGPWQIVTSKSGKTVAELLRSNDKFKPAQDLAPFLKDIKEPVLTTLGHGAQSSAFQLANGGVLKVSRLLSRERASDWGKLPYDARQMFGPLFFDERPIDVGDKFKASALTIQEPLFTPVSQKMAAALQKAMKRKGVVFHDFDTRIAGEQVSWAVDQVGINAHGKPVMMDYGARYDGARYKSNR